MEWVAYVSVASLVMSTALLIALVIGQRLRRSGGSSGGTMTAESVAYWLLLHIAHNERKAVGDHGANIDPPADRKWVLDTFAECMVAMRNPENRLGPGA